VANEQQVKKSHIEQSAIYLDILGHPVHTERANKYLRHCTVVIMRIHAHIVQKFARKPYIETNIPVQCTHELAMGSAGLGRLCQRYHIL